MSPVLDAAPPRPESAAAQPRRARRRLSPLGLLGTGLLVVLLVRTLVLEPVFVPTRSMAPTIDAGEHVLVRHGTDPADLVGGEVVLFRAPGGELMVKRVVAVAGQRVGLRDGRLVVDGEVRQEPYADRVEGVFFGPVDVPAGHMFVMGDKRFMSEDSRVYGSLPLSSVEGDVLAVWWPLDAARWVR